MFIEEETTVTDDYVLAAGRPRLGWAMLCSQVNDARVGSLWQLNKCQFSLLIYINSNIVETEC